MPSLSAGYSAEKAALISGINDTTYIFSVIIAVFIIDRIGRRKTLFYGSVAMASTLVIACAAAYMVNKSEGAALDRYGALVASMVVLYTASFGKCALPQGCRGCAVSDLFILAFLQVPLGSLVSLSGSL